MSQSIIGLEELYKKLDKLVAKEALTEGLTKACIRVESEAKEKAPVDDGTLRMSITHEVDAANLKGIVGTNVEYAPYVEFGTGIYAAGGDGRKDPWRYQDAEGNWHFTIGQQPQPFMLPALEENKDKIAKDITKSILAYMKKVSK